jgi:restriction system protein
MTIPDFETLMKPMLVYASDKQEHSYRDTIEFLEDKYNLSEKKNFYLSG